MIGDPGVGDAVWIALIGLGGIVGIVIVTIIALVLRREMRAKMGGLELTLGKVYTAVNDRDDGALTISAEVSLIAAKVHDVGDAVEGLKVDGERRWLVHDAALLSLDQRVSAIEVRLSAVEVAQPVGADDDVLPPSPDGVQAPAT
jgi:hypothetical protein